MILSEATYCSEYVGNTVSVVSFGATRNQVSPLATPSIVKLTPS